MRSGFFFVLYTVARLNDEPVLNLLNSSGKLTSSYKDENLLLNCVMLP